MPNAEPYGINLLVEEFYVTDAVIMNLHSPKNVNHAEFEELILKLQTIFAEAEHEHRNDLTVTFRISKDLFVKNKESIVKKLLFFGSEEYFLKIYRWEDFFS